MTRRKVSDFECHLLAAHFSYTWELLFHLLGNSWRKAWTKFLRNCTPSLHGVCWAKVIFVLQILNSYVILFPCDFTHENYVRRNIYDACSCSLVGAHHACMDCDAWNVHVTWRVRQKRSSLRQNLRKKSELTQTKPENTNLVLSCPFQWLVPCCGLETQKLHLACFPRCWILNQWSLGFEEKRWLPRDPRIKKPKILQREKKEKLSLGYKSQEEISFWGFPCSFRIFFIFGNTVFEL